MTERKNKLEVFSHLVMTISFGRSKSDEMTSFSLSLSLSLLIFYVGNFSVFLYAAEGPSNYLSCSSCSGHFVNLLLGVHLWFKSFRRPRTSPGLILPTFFSYLERSF